MNSIDKIQKSRAETGASLSTPEHYNVPEVRAFLQSIGVCAMNP